MNIVEYQSEMQSEVAAHYNHAAEALSHCYPMNEKEMGDWIYGLRMEMGR